MRNGEDNGGLSSAEARRRLQRFGPNKLPEPKDPGPVLILLAQFLSPFIYILMIAAAVSLLIGQIPSAVFISAVLLLNASIGTVQEYSAQRSASALRRLVRGTAHVIRDGMARTIDVEALVPGDLVLLSSGDKVPADIGLMQTQSLAVDESMLTGESLAVSKSAEATVAAEAPLAERIDSCFAGSIVTHGRGQGIVSHTGLHTEIGRIARHVGRRRVSEPPLMIRIRRFTYTVAGAIGIAIVLLAGMMALRGGYDIQVMIMMVIGLAVSTIPEGLPAALTVALAIGMRRMALHRVIIRKLVAVEALGSCTFICSDKTGTLTVNELTIRRAVLPDGEGFTVSGEGVGPGGRIEGGDLQRLRDLCIAGVLANESYLDYAGGEWVSDGDIVDVAFLVFAKKLGLSLTEIRDMLKRVELIPYESERAFSGSLTRRGGELHLHAKGSPEKMLSMCSRMRTADGDVPIEAAAIERQFEALARDGYRIIALALRAADGAGVWDQLHEMTFLGMVGMIDPVRPEARDAVRRCRTGGIGVAMVTGDHPTTALAIAREIGIAEDDQPVVTGAMIRETGERGEAALDALIRPARVFARIEPTQKEGIVESFMRAGHFVAVTGDGVNDAPAMRRANTGVAMGGRGTDVAKEAADLIITDDNFASIVDGIEQGRIVYNNIRKVIALLVATGFSALLLFFCTVLAGLPMPMTAIQLLWLNLVANGLQDVALAFEPKEGHELARHPRHPREPIFERRIVEHVLLTGAVMGGLAFATFYFLMDSGASIERARNLTLMLMVLFGNIHALNSRSESRSLFRLRFFSNPFLILAVPFAQAVHVGAMYTPGLRNVLDVAPISLAEWLVLLTIALSLLVVEEAHKAWLRWHENNSRLRRN
ncbi:MAG: HAD-IC family P-type ATPase [Alphaproteobacteria bacterium]|nr:HAD-IC family P-type ATPase [Alphaproteobacteria bacterium]MDP6567829.1 HAD-IC family P-type ATPase [Alphaproteobacteria bacterium]MDP6813353.1 HAD-IC family P-type ATPase [Alphaproteobacteria bacterium]